MQTRKESLSLAVHHAHLHSFLPPLSTPQSPPPPSPEKQLPRVSPTFILPRRFLLLPLS